MTDPAYVPGTVEWIARREAARVALAIAQSATSQEVASQAAQLALPSSVEVAIRTDESVAYTRNGGSTGTMADWNALPGSVESGSAEDVAFTPAAGVAATDVQGAVEEVAGDVALALPKAGGTMTGALVLAADPATALEAATRQYVLAQIAALIAGAPGALDTLNEIAAQLATDESAVGALVTTVAGKLGLDVIDAKGDLIAGSAADTVVRKGVGSNGQILTADSADAAGFKWAPPAAQALGALTDVDAPTAVVDGAVLVYDQAAGKFKGQAQVALDVDAKGDLLVASAADVLARLPVGADGKVLTADSGEALGLGWDDPPSGTGATPTMAAGDYIKSRGITLSTIAGTNGFAYFTRVLVPVARTFDQIACNTTVAAGTTGTARMAIWTDVAGRPGALILDAGTVSTLTTTGIRGITISQLLPAGYYWLATQNEHTGTAPTYSSVAADIGLPGPAINVLYTGTAVAHTGAFSASPPAGASSLDTTSKIATALRAA